MLVSEIEEDKRVVVDVMHGTNKLSFETKSVTVVDDALLIDCIRHNNKIINMNGKNLLINVTVSTAPVPVKFSEVQIDAVKYKGQTFHLIRTDKEGKEVNRRQNFRVFIGAEGLAQIGEHKQTRNVIVKDVSIGGFAIVSSVDLELEAASVRLMYYDKNTKIVLNGMIVRKEIIDENKIVYGCELTEVPQGLSAYINKKQTDKKA